MAGAALRIEAVTIGEAARRIGLTPRAVRYYERIGLIEAASRSSRNYRLYDDKALSELRFIARCRAIGMTVAEIRALRSASHPQTKDNRKSDLLRQQLQLTEGRIRQLLSVRRELRHKLGPSPADSNLATALDGTVGTKRFIARH